MAIRLTVNQVPVETDAPDDMRLITFLRDHLKLTGAKQGCMSGHCGVCTVVINDNAVPSCRIRLSELDGADITTVEGISINNELHPLQAAFLKFGAVGCGYCTPGMLMAAFALLRHNPLPGRNSIRRALKRNLCRCTGYLPIENAILWAAQALDSGSTSDSTGFSGMGAIPWKVDGLQKVNGSAKFSFDTDQPGMLHGAVFQSPVATGELAALDLDNALNSKGVYRIVTHCDIPGENTLGRWKQDRPLLVETSIRFAGDLLALVIADTFENALQAASKINPVIRKSCGFFDLKPAIANPESIDPNRIAAQLRIKKGRDFSAECDLMTVSSTFQTPFLDHGLLEPVCASAFVDVDGVVHVCGPTQNLFFDRLEICRILGFSQREIHRVRMIQPVIGAAFGKHEDLTAQPLAALAAYLTGKPVKVTFTSRQSLTATTKRHPFTVFHQSLIDSKGSIAHQKIQILADKGAYSSWAPNILRKSAVHASGPYRIDSAEVEARSVFSNSAFSGAMRGFGAIQTLMAAELHIDAIARALKIDPLEYRKKICIKPGDTTLTGQFVTPDCSISELLDLAASKSGWYEKKAVSTSSGDIRGMGIAGGFYGIGYGNNIPDKGHVDLTVTKDGNLEIACGAVDYGQGIQTVLCQLAFESLGIPWSRIKMITPDTELTPDSGSTVASRQTFVTGNALLNACSVLRKNWISNLCNTHHWNPEFVRLNAGTWETPQGKIPWEQLFMFLQKNGSLLQSSARYLNKTFCLDAKDGQGDVYRTYSFAAACAEVTIKRKTGRVQVDRIVCTHDSGQIVNPVLAKAQVTGGAVMAAGMVLKEEYLVKNGIPVSTGFQNYKIPRFGDFPNIEVYFIESEQNPGPYGAKGLGEPAMIAAGPAIVNAVSNATGVSITRIPLDRRYILGCLQSAQSI